MSHRVCMLLRPAAEHRSNGVSDVTSAPDQSLLKTRQNYESHRDCLLPCGQGKNSDSVSLARALSNPKQEINGL